MKTIINSNNHFPDSTENPENGIDLDFRRLVDASPIAFYTTDANGFLTFFNKAAENLWGRTPDIKTEKWCGSWKVFYPDGKPIPVEEYPMAKALKESRAFENQRITIERPDHSFKNLLVFAKPFYTEEGKLAGAHNTLVDITEQQSNEIKRATLSAIVESSDDAIISKNLDGTITSWNSGAERIFKYTEEEILGKSIQVLIPDSRQEDENIIMQSIIKGNRVDHFETIRMDKFGNEIPLSLTVSPLKDTRGRIIGASKVARDISDRLVGEERQAVLSAIVESSDDAIVSKDLNGTIMSWNAGAEQIFGYKEEEVLGKSITVLIPEERIEEENLIITKIRKGERVQHFETVRKDKFGREFPVSLTVSPVKDHLGKIVGASKIARDISSQVAAQQQIKKHTRHLEILNSLGKSISRKMDPQHIIQQVTDATTKLTGAAFGAFFYNKKEEGENLMLFTISGAPREDFEKFGMPRSTDIFHSTFEGQGIMRVDDITKDPRYGNNPPHLGIPEDHPIVTSYLSVPVTTSSGSVIGGLVFGHPDPGVFKKEHEDLVNNIAAQASISLENSILFEQVKSLSDKKDEFIAVASHELKTPLTTIKGYLQVLAKIEKDKMSELFLNKSLNQVNNLNTLVDDLLNMSRLEAGKLEFSRESLDLRQMLLEMTETFIYSHKSHELIYELGEGPLYFEGDKQRLEQAVNNLLTNAVKYSPKAKNVYLKLTTKSDTVRISVRDEGMGLTTRQREQIFSRYYRAETTKGISGLGLGLYLTKQIIDRHGGKIEVESMPGKGSEFTFVLPLKKAEKTTI